MRYFPEVYGCYITPGYLYFFRLKHWGEEMENV